MASNIRRKAIRPGRAYRGYRHAALGGQVVVKVASCRRRSPLPVFLALEVWRSVEDEHRGVLNDGGNFKTTVTIGLNINPSLSLSCNTETNCILFAHV